MGGSGENGSLERDGTNKRDLSLDTQPPTKKKKNRCGIILITLP